MLKLPTLTPMFLVYNDLFVACSSLVYEDHIIYVFDSGRKTGYIMKLLPGERKKRAIPILENAMAKRVGKKIL